MRDRASELGITIWASLLILVVVAMLSFGGTWINAKLLPWWYGVQRETTENSKSFVDSTNTNLMNLRLEYVRLQGKIDSASAPDQGAYKAQQGAILEQMCTIISTMNKSTVQPAIMGFVNENGGC